MDAQIWITGDTGEEITALGEWLRDEDELRGRIHAVRGGSTLPLIEHR